MLSLSDPGIAECIAALLVGPLMIWAYAKAYCTDPFYDLADERKPKRKEIDRG